MGIICHNDNKRKDISGQHLNTTRNTITSTNTVTNTNSNTNINTNTISNGQNDSEYASLEELQGIIEYLLKRKKYLENDLNIQNQNNDNEIPNNIKECQEMIDKLSDEVFELEKKNNLWNSPNNNIQIRFFLINKYIL